MQSKRLLIAEDEAALRDFIARNLRARGFEVLEATNGLEALALWENEQPSLLVLDVMMPRMDGLEVCRRVRERSTVPIIVLTALDTERDKVAALDLGADDYLTKPFGVEELLARVRAVLRRAPMGRRGASGGCAALRRPGDRSGRSLCTAAGCAARRSN
jgi:two-component system, OmpR family, KDP operon response regulator KdpE